jgi:hypothetical protein
LEEREKREKEGGRFRYVSDTEEEGRERGEDQVVERDKREMEGT